LKKAAVAPCDGICSGDITVIEAISDKLLEELLPFVVQNDDFFCFAMGKSAGSLSPRVKWEHLKEYELELPPLPEQKKIADLLWTGNAVIESYRELIAATEELVKSRFVEMFGGGDLPRKKISDFIDSNISTVGQKYEKTDVIKYIDISSIDNSQQEIVQYTDHVVETAPSRAQQIVRKGDVLISTVRPNLRKVATIKDDYENLVASTGFCVLRPNRQTATEYLFAVVSNVSFAEYLARRAKGANYPAVNGSDIKEYEIPQPDLDAQTRFADFVRQADKSKFAVELAGQIEKAILDV
jgi:type I restriction enzyme S subunit